MTRGPSQLSYLLGGTHSDKINYLSKNTWTLESYNDKQEIQNFYQGYLLKNNNFCQKCLKRELSTELHIAEMLHTRQYLVISHVYRSSIRQWYLRELILSQLLKYLEKRKEKKKGKKKKKKTKYYKIP